MKLLSIGAFLKLLLIECNNICSINPIESDVDSTGDNLIRAFKKGVEKSYKKEHSTTFYANELHITPDYLNRTIKSRIGKTTKEIAYELGFNAPANFSAFVKKNTKVFPSDFKRNQN